MTTDKYHLCFKFTSTLIRVFFTVFCFCFYKWISWKTNIVIKAAESFPFGIKISKAFSSLRKIIGPPLSMEQFYTNKRVFVWFQRSWLLQVHFIFVMYVLMAFFNYYFYLVCFEETGNVWYLTRVKRVWLRFISQIWGRRTIELLERPAVCT